MIVRRETPADHGLVHSLHRAAFAPEDGTPALEAALTDRLREGPWFVPELSLVATDGAGVIGHVIATRGTVEPGGEPGLGLGPLGVVPAWQGRGVGSALMHAVLAAAEATGSSLVCLVGSPRFYGRFGFRPAVELGIASPDPAWGGAFQARALGQGPTPSGTFRYADPFGQ